MRDTYSSPQQPKYVPDVSRETLDELASRIRPIVRFARGRDGLFRNDEHGVPFYIQPVDPYRTAYTWDPKPTDEVSGLVPVQDMTTYHSWSYYGFFKPSIAEVLAQVAMLPPEIQSRIVAFEIVEQPQVAEDFSRTPEIRAAFNAGYHTATTRLYTLEG